MRRLRRLRNFSTNMPLTMHSLAPKKGSRTKAFRIGRGPGTGRGKTAGRGTKGQRSRTGGRNKLKMKGMKQMLLAFPKMRGFQSRYAKSVTITVGALERFASGSKIDLDVLKKVSLAPRVARSAKIVACGTLTKSLTLKGIEASAGAKKAIEAAGGKVV